MQSSILHGESWVSNMKNYDVVYHIQTKRWKNLKLIAKDMKVTTNGLGKLKITLDVGQATLENSSSDGDVFNKYFYEEIQNG